MSSDIESPSEADSGSEYGVNFAGSPVSTGSTQDGGGLPGLFPARPERPDRPDRGGASGNGSNNNSNFYYDHFYDRFEGLDAYDDDVTYEDKVLESHGVIKLTNTVSVGNTTESSVVTGSDWKLTDVICVRCENTSYYNVVLTMQPAHDGNKAQMSICIQQCPSRNNLTQGPLGTFKSCVVTMKFLGDYGTVITKHLQVERHGFCRGLSHPYRNEISSVTNTNFHELEPLRLLCQTQEMQTSEYRRRSWSSTAATTEKFEYIPVEVDISLKLKTIASIADCEKKNPNENFSFTLFSKKRKSQPHTFEPWPKKLRTDETFADVIFKVGPTLSHEFKAHKCILAARSPVFSAMFQADMKEKNSGEIELPDVDASTMNTFLYFLYETDQKNLIWDPKVTLDVLEIAHKYQIQDLIDGCSQSLVSMPSDNFSIKIALDIFSTANRFGIPDLEFKALQCVTQNKEKLNTPDGRSAIRDFMKEQYELSPSLMVGLFGTS